MANPDSGFVRPIYHIEWSLQYVWNVATLVWEPMTQPGGGGGGAVTIADGADVAQGATTDAESAAGNGTVIALLKRIRTLLGLTSTLVEQQTQTTHLATIAGDTTDIKTATEIMDDWDEADRAKVNPIVGQAGVQGGSGAVSGNTQRVVLATDVALPTGANILGRVGHDITGSGDGRKTVASAGTAEALAGSTACKRVVITAETDNTGVVVVGSGTVVAALGTRRGTPLFAGDSFELEIDNLADISLDVTVNGDGVTYTYFT